MISAKTFTTDDVAQHNQEKDAWLIINNDVYNVTQFLQLHPGGKKVMLDYLGQDASEIFRYFHDEESVLLKYQNLKIGRLDKYQEKEEKLEVTPFAEPNFFRGWKSPYYTQDHKKWVQLQMVPYYQQWDEEYGLPSEFLKQCGKDGVLALLVAEDDWPGKYRSSKEVCGHKIEKLDVFYGLILNDEINKVGASGIMAGLATGTAVGLPPAMLHATQILKDQIVKQCIDGEKLICLAITEPWAGSDVAQLQCSAVLEDDHYIVNGMKKWITNGIWSDYLTTAVRTSDQGMFGISLIVIDAKSPGVQRRKMKCQGLWASGTTFIIFDNVKVPKENLLGEENNGFKYMMINFNQERLGICSQAISLSRCLVAESFKFAHKRKTFGKRLVDHPVIRDKLARMINAVEQTQAYVEQCAYNFQNLSKRERNILISPGISLCKVQVTQTYALCAKEAMQIFGGLGYTRGGQGGKIERLYRDMKGSAVPGGSEEIMLDLAMRMSSRFMPNL